MATRFTCLKAHTRTSPLKTQTDSASIITSETLGIPVCRLASSFHEEGMDMESAEMERVARNRKRIGRNGIFLPAEVGMNGMEWKGMENSFSKRVKRMRRNEKEWRGIEKNRKIWNFS